MNLVMCNIDLDDKWGLKGDLFTMHTSECFGNSSVNHTCYFHTASALGHFTFQREKKEEKDYLDFLWRASRSVT